MTQERVYEKVDTQAWVGSKKRVPLGAPGGKARVRIPVLQGEGGTTSEGTEGIRTSAASSGG